MSYKYLIVDVPCASGRFSRQRGLHTAHVLEKQFHFPPRVGVFFAIKKHSRMDEWYDVCVFFDEFDERAEALAYHVIDTIKRNGQ